jgi:FkbM family methyltransferase
MNAASPLGLLVSATCTFTAGYAFAALFPAACPAAALVRPAAAPSMTPRRVYVDAGANDGRSITDFLADPRRAGAAWEVVMIEATAQFNAQLSAVCDGALASGRARSCRPLTSTALTTFNGVVDVFQETQRKQRDSSSIAADANVFNGFGSHVNATALDVVTLFRDVLHIQDEDYAVIKIDIEGAEFPVVTRALAHGLLPLWDEVFVEWRA